MTIFLSTLIALTVTLMDTRGEGSGRVPTEIARIEVANYYVDVYHLRDKIKTLVWGLAKIALPGKNLDELRVEVE